MAYQARPPTFGDLLRHARQARKLSLRQAAAMISRESGQPISHTYLHALEKGGRNPSLGMVQVLACVYTLDEAHLLSEAAHGIEIVRTYLQRRPEAAPSFLRLMLWADRTNFAAWERLWRQSMAGSDMRSGTSPIP